MSSIDDDISESSHSYGNNETLEAAKKQEEQTSTNDKPDVKNEKSDEKPADVVEKKSKIDILLKPTGDAPIMKKKKWAVNPSQNIGSIIDFMRRYLNLESADSLFLYVNQAFAPSPDQEIGNLYECFGSDGKLVLHYAKSQAWG